MRAYAGRVPTATAQITALVYGYAERIDAGDFAGLADLLATAEITYEGYERVTHGRDEVLAVYEASTRRYPDGTPLTKHVTTNLVIEVDEAGGTATGRAYYTVLQAVPGQLTLQPIVAGRYRDRFERQGGEWRFAARHIAVDLVGELGHHMLFDLPTGP